MLQSGFEPGFLKEQLTGSSVTTRPVQMGEGVYHWQSLGNAGFVVTEEGVVVIDTGNPVNPPAFLAALRSITQEPIRMIIYTHGHVDHAANALPLLEEACERGDPRPRILAHRNVEKRFVRYAKTRGLQDRINRIQFGLPPEHPGWPSNDMFVRPDETYDDYMTFEMGGVTFVLSHAYGETDDATWIWIPKRRAIFSGDLFISSCPNIGNPLKIQRFDIEWAEALELMATHQAIVLGPGHGPVLFGSDRIADALLTTAQALRYLEDAVIGRLNAGKREAQILEEVHLPKDLASHWALRPIYGCPEFIVRGIYHRHCGWWNDGHPAQLFPCSHQAIAREIVALCGPSALFARASQLVDEGNLQLALHLLDYLDASDASQDILQRTLTLKTEILSLLSEETPSYIAKNILR